MILTLRFIAQVSVVTTSVWVLYIIAVVIYNLYFHPLAKFPGPVSRAGVHLVEYWHLLNGTQPQSIKGLHDRYGEIVRIRPDSLTFKTSQAWQDIYGTHASKREIPKDPSFYVVGTDGKTQIVYSNEADHARMRKLLSHAFSDTALREQEPLLAPYFELLLSQLKKQVDGPTNGKVDLTRWYNFLTFDIIGDLCFSESFHTLESGKYHPWMSNMLEGVSFSKLATFFTIATFYKPLLTILKAIAKLNPSLSKSKEEHDRFICRMTSERLDHKTDRKDFMNYILRYNDERGMSRDEIIETSGIIIIAGSETVSTLLAGATYYLLKNPRVYAEAKKEVRNAFKTAEEMTLTSTGQLSYVHALLQEAFRLYPPVPNALPRRTRPEGAVIAGVFIPGNTAVAVAQYTAYRSESNFAEPETFAPERWLPDPPAQYCNDQRDVLKPFSTGPRNCIGKNLAWNELRSVMARMLWHFDMELCTESMEWNRNQGIWFNWEKPALNVKLSHRKFD